MTLEEQIKDLECQRDAQLRDATYLFARTKRDLRRKISPQRIVRKNIGVAMAAAAISAMFLAPGSHHTKKVDPESVTAAPPGPASGWRATLRGLLQAPLQKLAGMAGVQQPTTNGEQRTEQKRRRSVLELLLAELATVAARQVNWNALLHYVLQRVSPAAHKNNASEEPRVAVADVGTTPSDQILDGKLKS